MLTGVIGQIGNTRLYVLESDVTAPTTSGVDVTGFSFTGVAGKVYQIEGVFTMQSAATTTGMAWCFDGPADMGVSTIAIHAGSSNTAPVMNKSIADNTFGTSSTAVPVQDENNPVAFKAVVNITTGGTVQLKIRSEVAMSAVKLVGGLTVMSVTELN